MEFNKLSVVLLLALTSFICHAQVNRYMVFFEKRNESAYAATSPEEFLTPRALVRREREKMSVTIEDFPVDPKYLNRIDSAGGEIIHVTRWLNGALVQCDASLISVLGGLPGVIKTELVARGPKPTSTGGRIRGGGRSKDGHAGTLTQAQLSMLGIDEMHAAGFRGEGISIAVFDSGFPGVNSTAPFVHLFSDGRIHTDVSYDFVHGTPNVFAHDDHGTRTFSILAAYEQDVFTGGAYKADFTLFITEDDLSEYKVEEYNWLFAAEKADSLGVDIISSSLGYYDFDDSSLNYSKSDIDGKTAVSTLAASMAAQRGILVVVSAGNEAFNSWGTITAPADAENILAVGGTTSSGKKYASSSPGPSADGRIKPDLAALGTGVSIITGSGNKTTGTGTSYSAPLVAGLAAGVWQKNPELTVTELIELIKSTASQFDQPDNLLGYGIPNYRALITKTEWKEQDEVFEVYPNPVNADTLNIRPRNPEEIDSCTIEIVSMDGRLILKKEIDFTWLNGIYTADCSTLPPGVYYLHIRSNNHAVSLKFVKI